MFTVLAAEPSYVPLVTVVPFFCIVKLYGFFNVVGIVGLFDRSVYEPEVATVAKLGLPVTLPHAIDPAVVA